MYNYVITPFGVVLLVYPPEGGGRINRNTTTKGVITCLLPLLGELLSNPRARVYCTAYST